MISDDILFDLKFICKNNPNGITMFQFKNMECRKYGIKNPKRWGEIMRYLVAVKKIEIFGLERRIKPVISETERGTDNEVRITTDLIRDIVGEMKSVKPTDAHRFCIKKYGWCNSESFTRIMRDMAEEKENRPCILERDENGLYHLASRK